MILLLRRHSKIDAPFAAEISLDSTTLGNAHLHHGVDIFEHR